MAQWTIQFLMTIIVIYHTSILTGAGKVTKIITGRQSYWGSCSSDLLERYPRVFSYDEVMSDSRMSRPNFEETMNCKDNEWIVDWNADDLGKMRNQKNCLPVPSSHKNGDCSSCLCARDSTKTDCVDVDGYYWGLIETNIDENKFMSGLRLSVYSTEIMFYYAHRTLLPNDEYDITEQHGWGASRRSSYDTDCEHLSNNVRTIFLDDVILPAEYIVTGVRMAAIEEYEGYKGWKLQVKGTKYNSSFKLLSGTSQWFDYTNHANNDTSYDRERTEIDVANTGATNRFVRFRGSTLTGEKKHTVLPYISDEAGYFYTPWGGVGLTYEGGSNFEGSLKVKAFRHGSYQFTNPAPVREKYGRIELVLSKTKPSHMNN